MRDNPVLVLNLDYCTLFFRGDLPVKCMDFYLVSNCFLIPFMHVSSVSFLFLFFSRKKLGLNWLFAIGYLIYFTFIGWKDFHKALLLLVLFPPSFPCGVIAKQDAPQWSHGFI